MHGRIQITEQGESVTNRYGFPDLAHRHLEQVIHAVLLTSGKRPCARRGTRRRRGKQRSMRPVRAGARQPTAASSTTRRPCCGYFHAATPIDEIGRLNIGSRPARRQRHAATSTDLRAIPWVFAWTQSRAELPGWYGLGSALAGWAGEDEARWDLLGARCTATGPSSAR